MDTDNKAKSLEDIKKEMDEMKASLQRFAKYEMKADACCDVEKTSHEIAYCHERMSHCFDAMWKLESRIYELFFGHQKGHLPPINSPGKLEKACKVLGIADDVIIEKPRIYASKVSSTNRGFDIEVDFK